MQSLTLQLITAAAITTVWTTQTIADDASLADGIKGVTGRIDSAAIAVPADERIQPLAGVQPPHDLDLRRMARWALNYLINTPREQYNFEPVFQCHPLEFPPIPDHRDPVVVCDTEARMEWEWYYMRDVSGSDAGRDAEAILHNRLRSYIDEHGVVLCEPGAYHEGQWDKVWTKEEYVVHTWGATMIFKSLAEDYIRTKSPESHELARKVMLALRKAAVYDADGRCWFPQGMGPAKVHRQPDDERLRLAQWRQEADPADFTITPAYWSSWSVHPAPVVESLVVYWQATGDEDALAFARAYSEGIIHNRQPYGMIFQSDGSFRAHGHATMRAVWGVAHLGLVTNEPRYLDFAERAWNFMLSRGTGTGWFPAYPGLADTVNEMCLLSDMMSISAVLARAGRPEHFDYVERYLRNYVSNLQFIVTPQFESYYRSLHPDKPAGQVDAALDTLRKFQGGIIGGSGLTDYENELMNHGNGFMMFGCCAPEGMRAIYTAWTSVIDRLPESALGPEGVYVNLSLNRESPWGRVVSFFPEKGRLTVVAAAKDRYFLRPPHWAPRDQVRAFVGDQPVEVRWSNAHVMFDADAGDELTITYPLISFTHEVTGAELCPASFPNLRVKFEWRGNMVMAADPAPTKTPLFTGSPRRLPDPPY